MQTDHLGNCCSPSDELGQLMDGFQRYLISIIDILIINNSFFLLLKVSSSFDGLKPFMNFPCHYPIVNLYSSYSTSLGAQWDWEMVN